MSPFVVDWLKAGNQFVARAHPSAAAVAAAIASAANLLWTIGCGYKTPETVLILNRNHVRGRQKSRSSSNRNEVICLRKLHTRWLAARLAQSGYRGAKLMTQLSFATAAVRGARRATGPVRALEAINLSARFDSGSQR